MNLSYTTDAALQERGLKEYGRKTSGLPAWGYLAILWVPLTLLVRWGLSRNLMRDAATSGQLAAAAVVAGAFVLFIGWKARRPAASTSPEEISVSFDDQGMSKKTRQADARIAWGAFLRFVETDGFFFLHTTNVIAELIPKSAFGSAEQLAAFRTLLESKVRKTPQNGHPVLGKTRPVFYLLFGGILVALFVAVGVAGRSGRADVSVERYLDWKDEGLIREVSIRNGGELIVRLGEPYVFEGRSYEYVRVTIPPSKRGSADYLDDLVGDLPSRAVRDER